MDDVLMPYAIYSHGYAVPHIAAGINLNLPVIGPLLRKAGAFFMRRSFRGSALYSAVFTRYLGAIMARGHPIQYFIEGGRSRTGRSLAPKTGMLSMTLRSYLRQPVRPSCSCRSISATNASWKWTATWASCPASPRKRRPCWGSCVR
jgi:glycerol-3-phosphate O-acyltransferase